MTTDYLNSGNLPAPSGFSHVTVTGPGRLVFVSGQVSRNAAGDVVGAGDLAAQTEQVYRNLAGALKAAGASLSDLVKVVTYVVDLTPEKAALIRAVRSRHMPGEPFPASTLVGVASLVSPDLVIEIEAVAAIGA